MSRDLKDTSTPGPRQRPRICLVVAAPLTLKAFLLGHIEAMLAMAEVTAVANFTRADDDFPWPEGLIRIALPIARPIAPWTDLRALLALRRLFREQRYDLVHSITPKAGLLAMLTAKLAQVPVRLHTYTGQVWARAQGWRRGVLKRADRLIANCATQVLADSATQRDFLVAEDIVSEKRSAVLAFGSLCGVDAERFHPDQAARRRIRQALGIAPEDLVFLYLGRFNRDKGLFDLVRAFADISMRCAHAQLLLVGPDEGGLRPDLTRAVGGSATRLHFAGYSDRPQEYFAAADICCLPSYREGFPTTLLEAAATGIPAIGSRIYGITDAVVENETGLLFEAGNVAELAACMRRLADDPDLRAGLGRAARERALRDFSADTVTAALLSHYRALLRQQAR